MVLVYPQTGLGECAGGVFARLAYEGFFFEWRGGEPLAFGLVLDALALEPLETFGGNPGTALAFLALEGAFAAGKFGLLQFAGERLTLRAGLFEAFVLTAEIGLTLEAGGFERGLAFEQLGDAFFQRGEFGALALGLTREGGALFVDRLPSTTGVLEGCLEPGELERMVALQLFG